MNKEKFIKAYIEKLKVTSTGQPDRWYLWQADQAWITKLKRESNTNGKEKYII